MDLASNAPIKLNTVPTPESVLVCTFKLKGTKEKIKINVGLYIHQKNSINLVDILSSVESIYTDINDKKCAIKLKVPKYDTQKRVESHLLIFLHPPVSFNTKIQVEDINIELNSNIVINNTHIEEIIMSSNFNNNSSINVVCQGLMLGHSGFAKAMRNVAYNLDKLGCNVKTIILDGDNIKSGHTETGSRVLTLVRNISVNAANINKFWITMNIPLGIAAHPGYYNIPYIMFETVDYPPEFITHLRRMGIGEIWTPSNFCRDSMINAGLTDIPIIVMPLGVDTELFSKEKADGPRYIPGNLCNMTGKYKFLAVMGYSERKGVNILIRAFAEEFSNSNDKDKVALYLKGGWYDINKAGNEINAMLPDIPIQNRPLIHLDFNIYPDDVLISLYNACDCFVLPSRGEGWSLPMCEAMSMSLPTIGTRWSGNLEFMNDDNSYLINIEGHATEPRCNWITGQYIGRKFAVPNKTHLRQLMRHVYEHQEEALQKGKRAREHIAKNFDWSVSCNRMKDRLNYILTR
jgi:glycosyltransferase involved in cell wall biosynthesis